MAYKSENDLVRVEEEKRVTWRVVIKAGASCVDVLEALRHAVGNGATIDHDIVLSFKV